MPRPRRFRNDYGNFTKKTVNAGQYSYKIGELWYGPVTHNSVGDPTIRATRLTPKKSNFISPTTWGAVAERYDIADYDYHSVYSGRQYQWAGVGAGNGSGVLALPTSCRVSASASAVVVTIPTRLTNASNSSALNGIRDQVIDLSIFFGELSQTIRSLADVVVRVSRSLRHARKGRWGRAVQALNAGSLRNGHAVASTYATYVWALKPWLNDMYGMQEQVKKGLARNGRPIKSAGFASDAFTAGDCSLYRGKEYRFSGGGRSFSRTVYSMRIHSDVLYGINQLGLANPLATIWELFPLSFVIDWFLPIGDFLSALTGPLGTVFVSGFEDKVIEVNAQMDYCRGGLQNYLNGKIEHHHWQFFAFERRTLASIETPSLYIGAGLNNSVSRAISSIALLRLRAK